MWLALAKRFAARSVQKKTAVFHFPFRRTHFKADPGIRAKAAGKLIWPLPASPLQQLNHR